MKAIIKLIVALTILVAFFSLGTLISLMLDPHMRY